MKDTYRRAGAKILFVVSLLGGCDTLFSQTLTLQDAIETTLASHPDIRSFELKVKQSSAKKRSATADYLPQVTLSGSYNPVQTYVFPVNGSFNTKDEDGWVAGVSAKQKIWDFGATLSRIDASKEDEKIAKLSLKDLKKLYTYKVKALYALLIVEQEAINANAKNVALQEAHYKEAQALLKQGLKTKADTSRFYAALLSAKEALATAKASFKKAKSTLELYMNEKLDNNLTLERDFLKKDTALVMSSSKKLLQNNLALQISRENFKKSEYLHKSARSSHYGSLDAYASYNHVGALNEYDSKVAGISLVIPLYAGGRLSANEQQAKIAAQIAKEQSTSKRLELEDEVRALQIDIKHYSASIAAREAQKKAAKETLDVLQGRYKEGMSTYIEVLDASSQYLFAQLSLLEAYYKRSLAISKLEYIQGDKK